MVDHKDANQAREASFSRPVNVDKIKPQGLAETISATPQECEALTQQLKINSLEALSFNYKVLPWKKGGVEVSGVINATIEEICVVSLDPFTSEVSEPVKRFYERHSDVAAKNPLLDLETLDDLDDDLPDLIEDGMIDLGEVAVETLALSLSPYPRKPGVVFEDHVESDPELNDDSGRKNPFEILKDLKKH